MSNIYLGIDLSGRVVTPELPDGTTFENTTSRDVIRTSGGYKIVEFRTSGGSPYHYVELIYPSGSSIASMVFYLYSNGTTTNYSHKFPEDVGVVTYVDEDAVSYPYITRVNHEKTYLVTEDMNKVRYLPKVSQNQLINAEFNICQRYVPGLAVSGQGYGYDRWYQSAQAATVQAMAAHGWSEAQFNMMHVTTGGADVAAAMCQPLENFTEWIGKVVTVSAWIRANQDAEMLMGVGGSYRSFTVTNEWKKYTFTLTVEDIPSTEAWFTKGFRISRTRGIEPVITEYWFAAPMLCFGEVEPVYEARNITEDILLCKRFYEKSYVFSAQPGASGTSGYEQYRGVANAHFSTTIRYAVPKRVSPTVTYYSRAGTQGKASVGGTDVANDVDISTYSNSAVALEPGITASAITSDGIAIYFHWVSDAEIYE